MTASSDFLKSLQNRIAIGIDVGGTKCAAGLVEFPAGAVLAHRLRPTQPERGGAAVLDDILAIARSLHQQAIELDVAPTAIGIGVAELIGVDGAVLSNATIDWPEVGVRGALVDAVGIPVYIEADVRAAAWGEAHLGAGRVFGSFLHITVGTGISCCLVIDGIPFVGARGLTGTFASSSTLIAGENGRLVTGPPLERFAAGPALAERFAAVNAGFSGTAFDVLSLAEDGDASAQDVVSTGGIALGASIGQLVNVLDPEAVVIGGGLGLAEGRYRESLETAMREHIWCGLHRDLPLMSAELGKDAGFIGAALAAARF